MVTAGGGRTASRAVSREDLGAWLVKADPRVSPVAQMAGAGFADVRCWCVRPTYRTRLVAVGDPVLLWVSGGDETVPAGVHAVGEVTGEVRDRAGGPPEMPLRLRPLARPAPRADLLTDAELAGLEVLRSPWGSNPSFVTARQLRRLDELGLLAVGALGAPRSRS